MAFVHGTRGRVQAPSVPLVVAVVDPPEDITDPERAVWQLHAPDALAAGTLTPRTARSFVRLVCAPEVMYDRILATLEAEGWTFQKGTVFGPEPRTNPSQNRLEYWYRRIVDGHREYKLSPFGKAEVEQAKPEDPFAEFEVKA